MDDRVQKKPKEDEVRILSAEDRIEEMERSIYATELKTTQSKQEQQEITDFVYIGGGRFIRFRFQQRMNPRLVLLLSLHLISAIIAIAIMIFLNIWFGLIILFLATGLFNYLRSLVHPKFVRGWLLGEEAVVLPFTEVKLPPMPESGESNADERPNPPMKS